MKKSIVTLSKVLLILMLSTMVFGCSKKEVVEATEIKEATEAYRTVTIASINGSATVKHKDGQSIAAYEGMNLFDGDDIIVDENSNLIIDADSDKHLLAESGSHFWLSIEGTEDCTKTRINLDAGAVLCQIEEKLTDGESFDVSTASSTMCVRGTVFRVNAIKSLNNEQYNMVEVYDGKVWSYIGEEVEEIETGSDEEQVVLEPGQCALIKESTDGSQASYVTSDQIDANSWKSDDYSIVVKDTEGKGSPILTIAYNKLPSVVVDQLTAISEGGTELSVNKEELEKLSVTSSERESNLGEKDVHQALIVPGVIVDEHRSDLNDDICAEYGHSIITVNGVRQCSICGLKFSEEYQDTEKDKANYEAMVEQGMPTEWNFDLSGKKTHSDDTFFYSSDTNEKNTKDTNLTDSNPDKQTDKTPVDDKITGVEGSQKEEQNKDNNDEFTTSRQIEFY